MGRFVDEWIDRWMKEGGGTVFVWCERVFVRFVRVVLFSKTLLRWYSNSQKYLKSFEISFKVSYTIKSVCHL